MKPGDKVRINKIGLKTRTGDMKGRIGEVLEIRAERAVIQWEGATFRWVEHLDILEVVEDVPDDETVNAAEVQGNSEGVAAPQEEETGGGETGLPVHDGGTND